MPDQYVMRDPTTQYPKSGPEFSQQQPGPGLQQQMGPQPDAGEHSYRGTGRLTGRKAVVTGADSGIGRAVAIAFAREGADVVLSYLPQEEPDAQQVVQLIEDAGQRAVTMPGDVTDEAYCTELIETARREFGGVDVLANIAGKQQEVPDIADLTTEQFDETFKTDVYSLFWLCRAAVPQMPAGSAIINTTSVEAYEPAPILLDYAAAKSAINTFTKSLARQVAPKGIRVNAVAPGPVWTPLQVVGGQPASALKQFGAQTPLGRPAQPAEVAPAFVFLASQEASYVIGETLSATGGMPTP
ncbi:putative oxidoreductase YhxD [Micromonospora noduli]|uniref:SDR family oxidoreductase n=1 Tax=Micromonospora noduli TaxID=709876 RepID=UPI000DBFC1DD|nr:SDR family oxidoreductase [Micromonospora noduli]KAB1922664.1 SDR family oxidoreductase [Micromonospora noduli]RAO08117.1 putative oxidoreductase YhxD [Micromonospora noduli]RAO27625.1 putative oxidoreductase YhxD [Micromonospora noduli]